MEQKAIYQSELVLVPTLDFIYCISIQFSGLTEIKRCTSIHVVLIYIHMHIYIYIYIYTHTHIYIAISITHLV